MMTSGIFYEPRPHDVMRLETFGAPRTHDARRGPLCFGVAYQARLASLIEAPGSRDAALVDQEDGL
jgi:hypothetical protein